MCVHSNCTSKDTTKGKIVIKKERENIVECGEKNILLILFTFGCLWIYVHFGCVQRYIHVN